MVEYVKAHWRGELSLARSYWVNTFLLSLLLYAAIALIEEPLSRLAIQTILITALGSVVLFTVVAVWQLVGLWRSATNTKQKSSKRFWPGVVKFLVILGVLGNTSSILTTTSDLFKMIAAIQHPDFANYVVRREGDTDLILIGAINDDSVDDDP